MVEASYRLDRPLDLRSTLAPLRHGARDPTMVFRGGSVWRASQTPDGAATLRLAVDGEQLSATAWGPGASWALATVPNLVGLHDNDRDFGPIHPVLAGLARRLIGLRLPTSQAVFEALVPTVLAQKVTSGEAVNSYARLVGLLGEPAPGPPGRQGLRLAATPERLAATPTYALHPLGIERRRAETLKRAAVVATRLAETTTMAPADARRRLCLVPGIGAWTAAKVTMVALGDADAVCTGDFHLPNQVAWALAGQARADDRRMLELLEPFRGHRARVQRLIVAGGLMAPSFGPRHQVRSIAHI